MLEDIATGITARLMRSGVAPMTGPLKTVDGSVGAPAVQFANGATTGFYKTTNGIGVAIGGTKVAEFGSGGIVSGGHFIGELIPWTRLTAAPLTVLPYGQTLSRTTFADLWDVAQVEIAAGNTFYNNGNGTTTFGVGDMRGRVAAGKDDMGGTAANRLTSLYMTPNGTTLGGVGGLQNQTIVQGNLPAVTLATTINDPGHAHVTTGLFGNNGIGGAGTVQYNAIASAGGTSTAPNNVATTTVGTGITASTALGGSGAPLPTLQPTMITNFILFAGA